MKTLVLAVSLFMIAEHVSAQPGPVCDALTSARSQYGATMTTVEVGELLNRAVWGNPDWGLLGKRAGFNCPTPAGVSVSCDYLVHLPTLQGYDVLGDAGGASTVQCPTDGNDMTAAIKDGSRTFVAAVRPGGSDQPNTGTDVPPSVPPANLSAEINALIDLLAGLERKIDSVANQNERIFADLSNRLAIIAAQHEQQATAEKKTAIGTGDRVLQILTMLFGAASTVLHAK